MNKDDVRDTFRDGLLAALDLLAREVFGALPAAQGRAPGASDADLPALFADIDRHVDRLCERYDVVLVDYETVAQRKD
jgi:hypothetical protein